MVKKKKRLFPRIPLEWILNQGTKWFKDKSKYTRKKKHKKEVGDE